MARILVLRTDSGSELAQFFTEACRQAGHEVVQPCDTADLFAYLLADSYDMVVVYPHPRTLSIHRERFFVGRENTRDLRGIPTAIPLTLILDYCMRREIDVIHVLKADTDRSQAMATEDDDWWEEDFLPVPGGLAVHVGESVRNTSRTKRPAEAEAVLKAIDALLQRRGLRRAYRNREEHQANATAVTFLLGLPPDCSVADMAKGVLEAADLADSLHRALGGHGLQVRDVEVLESTHHPVEVT